MYNTRSQASLLKQSKRANQESILQSDPSKRHKSQNGDSHRNSATSSGSAEDSEHPNSPNGSPASDPIEISQDSSLAITIKGFTQNAFARVKPYGQPLIWAQFRQNLCEALPYYRAYQQGGYTSGGLGYGFLLDKDSGSRQFMDEEVVITRAGGGCKADNEGAMRQCVDQSMEATHITSFVNSRDRMVPVGLIVGSSNPTCPVVVPHRYCVMDWFQITDIWAEMNNDKTCFKFRFEKIDLNTKSWWAPKDSPLPPATRNFSVRAEVMTCQNCQHTSKRIFQQGWICLYEKCKYFWKLHGRNAPSNLVYSKDFLTERTSWPNSVRPAFELKPELPKQDPKDPTVSFSLTSWKGIVCPRCGRCISRTKWTGWECKTANCGYSIYIQPSPIPATSLLPEHTIEYLGHALPLDRYADPVLLRQPEFLGNWRIHTYSLMDGNTITHFHANGAINQQPGGAHELFLALQSADLGLQRFPLKTSPVQGELLTSHFATNFGMPYKYIVSVNSRPFVEAPKAIMMGLGKLTWAGKHAVGAKDYQNANELLALGYFEKQHIHYHDDGEKELGPTIATMSLGCEAEMSIRMKEKYFSLKRFRQQLNNPNVEVVPGCQLYEERLRLKHAWASGDPYEARSAFIAYEKRYMEVTKSKHARPCLTLTLRHGDIVVMHGRETQKYFEHEVVPKGKLRFALTSRYVIPDMVDKSEHWKGEYELDPSEIYDGDVSPTLDVAESPSSIDEEEPIDLDMEMSQNTVDDGFTEPFEVDMEMLRNIIDDGSTDREFLDQWEMLNGSDGF